MIYLLYGSDTDKSRQKLAEMVDSMLKKKPDASHAKLNDENFSAGALDELIGSMGLFSSKLIVECDRLFNDKEAKALVTERIKEIAESENIFIFREEELLKNELKVFQKHAQKIQEFKAKTAKQFKKENSFFIIADAFGNRDKKQLWVLYSKARMDDTAPEEIHGILFWQIKSMLLAAKSESAQEAGLNPFVYQRSKRFAQNFSKDELEGISTKVVSMYHDARRGVIDFDRSLEQFILEM